MPTTAVRLIHNSGVNMPGLAIEKGDNMPDENRRRSCSDSFELPYYGVLGSSIDQLYRNVCDMQSSNPSPSHASTVSCGDTSSIDSELRHLAGDIGDFHITSTDVTFPTKKAGKVLNNKSTKQGETKATGTISDGNMKRKASTRRIFDQSMKPKAPTRREKAKALTARISTENTKAKAIDSIISKRSNTDRRKPKPKLAKKASSFLEQDSEDPKGLMKQIARMIAKGEKSQQVVDLATKAANSLELLRKGNPDSDTIMSVYLLASIYCNLGKYEEAIVALKSIVEVPYTEREKGNNEARAEFSACLQIGDIYSLLGKLEDCVHWYNAGLEIQQKALGDGDPRYGETCRLLAEAHLQALQLDDAETHCQNALKTHRNVPMEEAADRRLMGIICEAKGRYEAALEHFVLASTLMAGNGDASEIASLDCSTGDALLSLGRYDEGVSAYEKALGLMKSNAGETSAEVASVYVRLANLCNMAGKIRDSRWYCDKALEIYEKHNQMEEVEKIGSGLMEICGILIKMRDIDGAVGVAEKAKETWGERKGKGIHEAEMGVLYYMMGKYEEAYGMFQEAIRKLRGSGGLVLGIALNQMGLTCVHRYAIHEAAEAFEQARSIMEDHCGPHHPDTLAVCSNLAGTYDAMGRLHQAIQMLQYVVAHTAPANPNLQDDKRRLLQLTKDARTTP